jgi:hypothetical protein
MAKITCGSLIRRASGPNILGTGGCLVQWPGKTEQLLLLTAARVLVGRTAEQFEAVEATDLPGKPIGCLYAWSDLKEPATADVALVHVDPALVDAGIGPLGVPTGTNLNPQLGDKLTIFANGQTHNLTITGPGDTDSGDRTISRVTPDSQALFTYRNQIICDPATDDRCVGAMAMDADNKIVGMVVGGDGRTFTLVTSIDALLTCTFGGPPGPALEVCTSVPATAKPPDKVTHPNPATPAVQQTGAAGAGNTDGSVGWVAKAPASYVGKAVGSGQCVAYVQEACGAPHTGEWRRGLLVKGRGKEIPSGTAIATFDPNGTYGNHEDGRSHAAVFDQELPDGLRVWDQWKGQPVHSRTIQFELGNNPKDVNNGDRFYVISRT